jgi:WD40 repeat protein/predicted Ser/Thr protein kinase
MLSICPSCQKAVPSENSEGVCPACFLIDLGLVAGGGEIPRFSLPGLAMCEEIARGGVGIVYRGQQSKPKRQLAVKVLQPQWARNKSVCSRFRREAQTIATLDHPAILPVYEVGEDYGLPWFSMKLATGGSLAEQIEDYRGQWRRIAQLVATLAEALDFAHRRGVLHRDIKPGNVLFDSEGRAYLGDFGLATEMERFDSNQTLHADVLGTPHYMSPEVACGKMGKATTASDVYGLGSVLYELLSGQPPYRAKSLPALLRQIVESDPEPLAQMSPVPPRDLIDICARSMEKDPRHRYSTAGALAEDLRRFLEGKPTIARPLNLVEATWRWCRRHPASAGLAMSVALLLMVLGIGSNVAAWRIKRAHENAEMHFREELLSQAASLRAARSPGFRDRALELIRQAAAPKEDAAFRLKRRSEVMCALAFPSVSESPMPEPPAPGMQFATASAGWKALAWHDPEHGTWQVIRAADGALISAGHGKGQPEYLSEDGRWLATQEGDKRWKLWLADGSQNSLAFESDGVVQDVSQDGRWVAWHMTGPSGRQLAQIREIASGRVAMSVEYPRVALSLKFSPDGQFCAVAPSFYLNDSKIPYSVRIYRCNDGALIRELAASLGNCVWCMTWSPDGRWLLAAERDGPVYIWDVESGNNRHILRGPGTQLWRAAFSQDGQKLATVSEDDLFTVFCLVSGRSLVQGRVSQAFSHGFQWQSDESFGPLMVDGRPTLIRYQPGAYCGYKSTDTRGGVLGIAASPDGRWTVLGDARHAWLWDHSCRQGRPSFASGLWNSFCFSPDGRRLYGAGEGGVKRWTMSEDGTEEGTLLSPPGNHTGIAVDHSGQLLAVDRAQNGRARILRQPDSEEPERTDFDLTRTFPDGAWIDVSPDGRFVAIGGHGGFNVLSIDGHKQLYADGSTVYEVRFSPDSRWLLVATDRYEIWSTENWRRQVVLDAPGFSGLAAQAAFHPRKPILAAGCNLGRIGLWSTNDWRLVGVLENPSEIPVRRMSFDASGAKLHFGSMAGIFATWDFNLLENELTSRGLGW